MKGCAGWWKKLKSRREGLQWMDRWTANAKKWNLCPLNTVFCKIQEDLNLISWNVSLTSEFEWRVANYQPQHHVNSWQAFLKGWLDFSCPPNTFFADVVSHITNGMQMTDIEVLNASFCLPLKMPYKGCVFIASGILTLSLLYHFPDYRVYQWSVSCLW